MHLQATIFGLETAISEGRLPGNNGVLGKRKKNLQRHLALGEEIGYGISHASGAAYKGKANNL
jgi:hypothetical protein